jgi:hypothetical protein
MQLSTLKRAIISGVENAVARPTRRRFDHLKQSVVIAGASSNPDCSTRPGISSRRPTQPWLGLASWGEAFHNNHHAFPWSAAFGLQRHEFDPGFWFIRALERIGWVWHVKTPSVTAVAQRAAAEG